ncbi:MAG: GFA family protein [Myxococcales bacterium]|nr:GFA family protein [Myxococcales bacterium]HIK86598.1 GFA family protein [Myxococcales bacterium]
MTEPIPSPEPALIRGSCLCGAVEFQIQGEVTPIQFCHATRCRKATGGAAAPEMLASLNDLTWIKGLERRQIYEAPLLDSPPAYHRAFCNKCGSPLPVEIPGTGFALLNPGILDDDPGTRAFRHAFIDQQATWHTISDELPTYPGQPPPPGNPEDD